MDKSTFRKKFWRIISYSVWPILYTGIVRALALHIFTTPFYFAPGGVSGLAELGYALTGLSTGYWLIIVNVPLFFLAFFLVGKREAIVCTASMLLSSGLILLFEMIPGFPMFTPPESSDLIGYAILAAVASGLLMAVPLGGLLWNCGTAGGTSFVAAVINKKWKHISVNWLTFVFDALVVFASFFVYFPWGKPFNENFAIGLMPVFYAMISLFVAAKASDVALHGFKTAYKFEIITNNPEEVAREIMERTNHGVTLVQAKGMYSGTQKSMLVCIIRKRQIAELQRIIKKYPDTFAYFASTSEVYGKFTK